MIITPGRLMIEEALPADMRGQFQELNIKGIRELFQSLAEKHPEQYRDVAQKLMSVGTDAMYTSGGYSFGLKHLLPSKVFQAHRAKLLPQIQKIATDPKLSQQEKNKRIVELVGKDRSKLTKAVFDEALAEKSPLALQIASGAKGKPFNLQSLIGGDLLYEDSHGKEAPIPILRSYSEGLSPAEYWAGTYGARKGVVDLKLATRDAGYFSKQLTQATHRLVVTEKDSKDPADPDSPKGLPVETMDPANEGALLAHTAGPYGRDTILTPKVMGHLNQLGISEVLVRSPAVGGPRDGGLYSRDVGVRERNGNLSPIGDFVGIGASQSIGEPISQAQISSKHTGGVAGAGASVSGFKAINQLVQVPKVYPGGAVHAQTDGKVQKIEEAPGGGTFIVVNDRPHYAAIGLQPKVKIGDQIEAGDMLSDGLINPAEIVRHKGIGEGRKAFIKAFRETAADANYNLNRRNIEVVARGLINHVALKDQLGEFLPDDIIPYSTIEHIYQPRPGHQVTTPNNALGKYLEKPILHHTIGTQVKPSMIKDLEKYGVKKLTVHPEPPVFENDMIRGMENLLYDPDWMTRMLGSNLSKGLLKAVHRGGVSDEKGTSYVPSLARGVDFGKYAPIKGFSPSDVIKGKNVI